MMDSGCAPLSLDGAFLATILGHVDCQAQAIGQGGYQALAAPGSPAAMLLTGALTIFVALIGYRLVLGNGMGVREGVMAAVKIGMVLVLATSWQAFRVLAYDVTLHGSAELAETIGAPVALPGAGGGLVAHLQAVDDELAELVKLGAGKPPDADMVVGPTPSMTPQQQQQQMTQIQSQLQRPRWDPARDAALLSDARGLYLAGAIASFAFVRLVAGILLALGPLFALFLLFESTRGLFEGWVRGLAGAALGALATSIILGVELALVEPWLAEILAARHADTPTPGVPIELLVVMLGFAATLLMALVAVARVAYGFRIARWRIASLPAWNGNIGNVVSRQPGSPLLQGRPEATPRTRARALADAVAAVQRREAATSIVAATSVRRGDVVQIDGAVSSDGTPSLGQGLRRRTRMRVSTGATRRDMRA